MTARQPDDADTADGDRSVEASFAGEAAVTMLHGGMTGLVGGAVIAVVGFVLALRRRRRRR